MELADVLRRRRMVRHYSDEPVARETLERIVATRSERGLQPGTPHVLVLTREQDYHDRYRKPDKLQEAEDDAPWRALLGIPDEVRIVAGLTLGHGAPDSEWSKRTSRATQRRRPLEELVRWNRW